MDQEKKFEKIKERKNPKKNMDFFIFFFKKT